MPDFNTFRMNEKLIGKLYTFRMKNTCLSNIDVNNPKYNKNIKVKTIGQNYFNEYEDWKNYINNGHKIDLEKLISENKKLIKLKTL